MTLRIRRILFYTLTALFIIIGIIAIFYSSGWRFNLETFKINKLGALFFEVTPDDAVITIDKTNFEFNPGLLRSGTLIANIFPKTYTVKVTKEGYQSWTKQLDVQPSLVVQVPPVLLLPEERQSELIKGNISNFWVGPKYFITSGPNGVLEFESEKILGNNVHNWSSDGEAVITKADAAYFFINLHKPQSALNLSLILKDSAPIRDIDFSPINKNRLIALTTEGLYMLDINNFAVKVLYQGNIKTANALGDKIIYAANETIWSYNLFTGLKEPVISQKFRGVKDIQVSPSEYYLSILESEGGLYIFNRKSLTLKHIADNASTMLFSPDSKKLAFTTNNKELAIYSLADGSSAPFNLGTIEKETMAWHKNSAYLFVKYPSGLYLLETNNLPPINFQIVDLENIKYHYGPAENIIYLLKEDSLYKLDLK